MNKQTLRDIDLAGRRVLMRVDFNCPVQDGKVVDDTRITAARPSLEYVLEQGGSLVLMSHLGRPGGRRKPEFTLRPVAVRLAEMLGRDVQFADDCIGEAVRASARSLQPGQVLLLENVRFHPEEEGKVTFPEGTTDAAKAEARADMQQRQETFARQLSEMGDVYANDAFGTAHRAHASTAVVTRFFDRAVAGFLMEKELTYLGQALASPEKPFVAIIGGAKISGKIEVITSLMGKVDALLIGGGMAYTFCRAMGLRIGNSICEEDKIELAGDILRQAEARGVALLLPTDHVVADGFDNDAQRKVVPRGAIEDGWEGLDIGPETVAAFSKTIATAKTVLWNGPMGCFEMPNFAAGTEAVAAAVAASGAVSIIGGGDSVSAVKKAGLADKMTHISTGGGASLEFLEGKRLPGVEALTDK